jgi:hypothetical protein
MLLHDEGSANVIRLRALGICIDPSRGKGHENYCPPGAGISDLSIFPYGAVIR